MPILRTFTNSHGIIITHHLSREQRYEPKCRFGKPTTRQTSYTLTQNIVADTHHIRNMEPSSPTVPRRRHSRSEALLRPILISIDDAVNTIRGRDTNGASDNDKTIRDGVIGKLMEHRYFGKFRKKTEEVDYNGPSSEDTGAIVQSVKEMNTWLCSPSIVASKAGTFARRVLGAAVSASGISHASLRNAIGPLQRTFVRHCSERRKRALSTGNASDL